MCGTQKNAASRWSAHKRLRQETKAADDSASLTIKSPTNKHLPACLPPHTQATVGLIRLKTLLPTGSKRELPCIPTQHSIKKKKKRFDANCSGGAFLEKRLTLNQQNPLQQLTKVKPFWIIMAFHLYCLTAAGSARNPS